MAERLLRPEDIRAATRWYVGLDPLTPSRKPRNVTARRLYWHAMHQSGFSQSEIADASQMDRSSVIVGLKHEVPACYVTGVLDRARSQMMEECNP